MEDESVVPAAAGRKKPFILFRIIQWLVTAFAGLVALVVLTSTDKLSLAGAPVVLFGLSLATFVGLAILHSPPVFFRLPTKAKVAAYVGVFVGIMVSGSYMEQMQGVYERTPQGAKEAELQRQVEAKSAVDEAKMAAENAKKSEAQQALNQVAQAKADKLEELAKVKKCLSWTGHYSPLEEDVKGRLHNPHAFEHVSTEAIGPTPDGDNVEMTFRAENGFGALREGWIRAKVNPDTCELQSAGSLNES